MGLNKEKLLGVIEAKRNNTWRSPNEFKVYVADVCEIRTKDGHKIVGHYNGEFFKNIQTGDKIEDIKKIRNTFWSPNPEFVFMSYLKALKNDGHK